MAIIWKPQKPEVYLAWNKAIFTEALEKISDWELKFCQSINIQLNLGGQLTQAQADKLESIYAKYTS